MDMPPFAIDNKHVLKNPPDDVKWRHGLPNYSKNITLWMRERSVAHKPGSLEEIVENIVKNWEIGQHLPFDCT